MPRGRKRPPFPLKHEEERALFSRLPQPIGDMCLFKVNTGLREDEVCGLRWKWEVRLEDGASVFAIPPAAHKGGDYEHYRLVVLNSVARAVIEANRGKHEEYVFVSKRTGEPLKCINNNPFQGARKAAGLPQCRVHDLKHTFGERLKAAGVPLELRQVLLGHRNENITTHYSMPRIRELIDAAERVVEVKDSSSVVRIIGGIVTTSPPKVPQEKTKATAKVA
jgi:integrase